MQLIEIRDAAIGDSYVQAVNARDLHKFLEVGKVFAAWIQERISAYSFLENQDYVVFSDFGNNPSGGRPTKEYAITVDMAKELSMVERNEKGKQARQYFIECERKAKAAPAFDPMVALNDPVWLRGTLTQYTEKVIELESRVQELLPAQGALDRISTADGSLCITEAAKALQMRPKDLFAWLRQNGWIYRRHGSAHDLGYQSKTSAGLLEHKIVTVQRADGSERITEQVRITPRGLTRLASLIKPPLAIAS